MNMGTEKQTFEEALARLEEVVRELEASQLSLDLALELFAEGITLSKYCNSCLEQAEQKIQMLMTDGELKDAPANLVGGNR
ncbi:Exodeoxyribonuclease VII small subunit [Desulforamulus aeronauticus DSM 10349]|uniref:Exodeoxyribonuclease 7 small subunit n=2 Tax=Desulforamulus aeronauticus TaxID=53343 RepID=A0A1M6PFK2_9FIRM|nr:Exodeoxyribonuclease VII small subunit [Desulforamulus aeronauticus DSM 10349]